MMTVRTDNIFWLGHDSFRIKGSRAIYIDPWEVGGPIADLILITHEHYDHCDPDTVKALFGPKTKIITNADSAVKLKESGLNESAITVVEPGDEIEVMGVKVEAVPSYNVNADFHPRSKGGLGFVITMDEVSVYHAGDTDFIPEMNGVKAQVALLPVSGKYTMTADEAVRAALAVKPEVVIPMHYGKIIGDAAMAEQFAEKLKGKIKVEIKPQVS